MTPEELEKLEKLKAADANNYNKFRDLYISRSGKYLFLSWVVVGLTVILLVVDRWLFHELLREVQSFFVVIALVSALLSIGLQYRYLRLTEDPVSDLFRDINLFIHGQRKTLPQRIASHRIAVNNINFFFWLAVISLLITSLSYLYRLPPEGTRQNSVSDDGRIEIDLVQVNDVYEILAQEKGSIGGMSRVATLKKEILKNNPNTFLIMSGDFLSPSIFNSIKGDDGEPVAGKQMIEMMNLAGFDMVTFGNHEFDISKKQLQARINESRFEWVSSNVSNIIPDEKQKKPQRAAFQKNGADIPGYLIKTVSDDDGTVARIGFIGLTLPSKLNDSLYADFDSTLSAARTVYNKIKNACDAVVAITHQSISDDIRLAQALPQLAAILGGHEHDMIFRIIGNVPISKAHLNARSAFVVKLQIDKNNKTHNVIPELRKLDEKIDKDYLVELIAEKWTANGYHYLLKLGFNVDEVIYDERPPLDARDITVRKDSSNFTNLLTGIMRKHYSKAELAMLNAGSIRYDDFIHPPVSTLELLKAMPYEGVIKLVEMSGLTLLRTLNSRKENIGTGSFILCSENVCNKGGEWYVNDKVVDAARSYQVSINDYLLKGTEGALAFLNPDAGFVKIVGEGSMVGETNLRKVLISEIKALHAGK